MDGCPTIPDRPRRLRSAHRRCVRARRALSGFPYWFAPFLNDRQSRKPSAHTMKAYRQDFAAIAILMTDGNPARLHGG